MPSTRDIHLPSALTLVLDTHIFSVFVAIFARLLNVPSVRHAGAKPSPGPLLGLCPFTSNHRFINADTRITLRGS